MKITLREITEKNWLQVIGLAMRPDQEKLAPPTVWSLAEAYVKPGAPQRHYLPLAVCVDQLIVGFLSLSYDPHSEDCYWINGLLIDRTHQGRGYGRAAMVAAIELITTDFPRCREIGLTVVPGSKTAERLYESLGFKNTGVVFEGEIEWKLPVR